jgi:predicted DNA-binding transcriptional regulator AlpA
MPQSTSPEPGLDALVDALVPRVLARLIERLGTDTFRQNDDSLFKPQEAAVYLRRSRSTLESWRAKGTGPEWLRIGPKSVGYRKSALDAFQRDRAPMAGELTPGKPACVKTAA